MIILDCGYVVMNMNKYLELKFPRKEGNVNRCRRFIHIFIDVYLFIIDA